MLSLCFAVPNKDTNLTAVDLSSSIYAPLAGCDETLPRKRQHKTISIHAPLAGCDIWDNRDFKSMDISIHAPLAGCDPAPKNRTMEVKIFQSTHPLRGATYQPHNH